MRKLILLLLLIAAPVLAQAPEAEIIADGLNNPRGLFFDAAGTLYIADAGTGGSDEVSGQFGPVRFGMTSVVYTVEAEASAPTELIGGLLSMAYFQDWVGAHGVIVTDDTIWVLLGMGHSAIDTPHSGLIAYDRATLDMVSFVDLGGYEAENNPDQDEIASNPSDFAIAPDGTVYIVDASANSLLSWTEADGVQTVHAWEDLPVPTSVAVAPDGSVYVGFLSAYPFDRGAARVEKWVDGELAETYGGLTAVTDVLVAADGSLYVVEMSSGIGDVGWNGASGRVARIAGDGTISDVATDLNFPYALAQDAEGALYVTINSAYSEPGSGQVIKLALE